MKTRLDVALVALGLVGSRSRADDLIKRGYVLVGGVPASKPAMMVDSRAKIRLRKHLDFVSRAGEKLASVAGDLKLDFRGKTILDVGSSTGGFTDFSLKHNASKIIAVDVGTNQLHPKLRDNIKVELHEKTDIRDVRTGKPKADGLVYIEPADTAVIDVSFISLRKILLSVSGLIRGDGQIIAMCKPQFEATEKMKNKGVVKNDTIRRQILKDFEIWLKANEFVIQAKRDSGLAGAKGNLERFYLLKLAR